MCTIEWHACNHCWHAGRRIAELEMHIALAQLIRNFKLEFRDEQPLNFIQKLFLHPERRMDLAFIDRKWTILISLIVTCSFIDNYHWCHICDTKTTIVPLCATIISGYLNLHVEMVVLSVFIDSCDFMCLLVPLGGCVGPSFPSSYTHNSAFIFIVSALSSFLGTMHMNVWLIIIMLWSWKLFS